MTIKTNKITPVGYLYAGEKYYYLIRPDQLDNDCEGTFKFLVVPFGTTPENIYHKCPREIVTTQFLLEYDTTIHQIECELPFDILDREENK